MWISSWCLSRYVTLIDDRVEGVRLDDGVTAFTVLSYCFSHKDSNALTAYLGPREEVISLKLDVLARCLEELHVACESANNGRETNVEFCVC